MFDLIPRPRAAPRRRARLLRLAAAAALATGALLALPAGALAAPPANDAFADATPITSLPFGDSVDATEATYESGEPSCGFPSERSVWYAYTPSHSEIVQATAYGATLAVFHVAGPGFGGLSPISGCVLSGYPARFQAWGGESYVFRLLPESPSASIPLNISVQSYPRPANDDFAGADQITSLPFTSTVEAIGATLESGEPSLSCYAPSPATVWYAFTPTTGRSYTVSSLSPFGSSQLAVYTGDTVGALSQLGCRAFGQALTFHGEAGTTYRFQVGSLFAGPFSFATPVGVTIDVTPDPVASIWFSPGDPSTFDTTQFYDQSYDPGGLGISGRSWDFGDGTTVENEQYPTHRYAADGDYQVTLTVTTPDGRSATGSRIVQVRTRDVAITKFAVPQSASAGQTRSITVGVSNVRSPETVVVYLRKRAAYGWSEQIGQLRQYVPVRSGGRTTDFKFTYTFTAADAVLGKVTFEAEAVIESGRDAIPGDNLAIALPTKVGR